MYIFSCNATAKIARENVAEGESMPFIVYINYEDLFGAEHLCKLYLMRAGFRDIVIEERKTINEKVIGKLKQRDEDAIAAIKKGFHIRMFDRH